MALLSPVSALSGRTLREISEKLQGWGFPEGFADSLEAARGQVASLPAPELSEWHVSPYFNPSGAVEKRDGREPSQLEPI